MINTQTREGEQIVLADRRWTTRHEIMRVATAASTPGGVAGVAGVAGQAAPLAIPA